MNPIEVGASSSFSAEFFRRPVPNDAQAVTDPQAPAAPRTCYHADRHGSHADFCAGPDFPVYQAEVRRNLDCLEAFCREQRMPDAGTIADRFRQFYENRFVTHYLQRYAEILDSRGKQSLDNFCDMIRDERIPLEAKLSAIRNLAHGITVCDTGTTTHLISADRDLSLATAGIRGAFWKIKEEQARSILLGATAAEFGSKPGYAGDEIHYVNAVWNYIGEAIGLVPIPDSRAPVVELAFLNDCLEKVRAAMTPDRLAKAVAEQFLGMFASRLAERGVPPSGACSATANEAFIEILADIHAHHGLRNDELDLYAFVWLDDAGTQYGVHGDPSLIAWALLKTLHAHHLLEGEPVCAGEWRDRTGVRCALLTFGAELAWRARYRSHDASARPLWDGDVDVDLLTLADLFEWPPVRGEAIVAPPSAAIRQALRCSDPDDLVRMPTSWLHELESVAEFIGRLGKDLTQAYLRANLAYFQTDLPSDQWNGVAERAMGTGTAILALARAWYSNPWTLLHDSRDNKGRTCVHRWLAQGNAQAIDAVRHLVAGEHFVSDDEIYRTLRGDEDTPALSEAMRAGHAAAIGAWHRLLVNPAILAATQNRLPTLLLGASDCGGALCLAFYHGHAEAIEAYGRLLSDRAILPHIKGDLVMLLKAESAAKAPGLFYAMQRGHSRSVEAFRLLLVDPLIHPHIKGSLPQLVSSVTVPKDTSGLWAAMRNGRGEAVRSYRKLLTDPAILPRISSCLVDLLIAAREGEKPPLAAALYIGHSDAIDAYHELLADPAIVPLVKDDLPKMLAAKSDVGTPGLAFALEDGYAGAIKAYHAMLVDAAILPSIAPHLPELVFARLATGTPGFILAMQNGHADAVRAFHGIVADAAILPHMAPLLPALLGARCKDGSTALGLALRAGYVKAIEAFRDMLVDPAILPHIRVALPDLLAARDLSGTRGLVTAWQAEQSAAVEAFQAMLADPAISPHISDNMDELVSTADEGSLRETVAPADPAPSRPSATPSGSGRRFSLRRLARSLVRRPA